MTGISSSIWLGAVLDRSRRQPAGRIIWSRILSGVLGRGGRIFRWHRGNGLHIILAFASTLRDATEIIDADLAAYGVKRRDLRHEP